MTSVDWSAHPLVLAPMAGGPATVALAAAVAEGGVFPFLAGAYLTPERLRADLAELRAITSAPFAVNVFAPSPDSPSMLQDALSVCRVAGSVGGRRRGRAGHPALRRRPLRRQGRPARRGRPGPGQLRVRVAPAEVVGRLQEVGTEVWVTVNEPSEVEWAVALGVDGLVVQGWEAGGHRGGPVDTGETQLELLPLVSEVARRTDLPIMGAGGVMTGAEAAAVLRAGAAAVALGTAFLGCPEAGTAPVHVHELTHRSGTTVTRAFTGRSARALTTTWTELFTEAAPAAYPHVHHVTAPLRAHGKATGEAELVHLWAGTGHARLRALPAAELARVLRRRAGAAAKTG